jgi:hypothetical protein
MAESKKVFRIDGVTCLTEHNGPGIGGAAQTSRRVPRALRNVCLHLAIFHRGCWLLKADLEAR